MKDVRFRDDTGWEGRCNECCEWWPLDNEFWYPRQGVARCRGCLNLSQRRGERQARASEMSALREADRRRYRREWEAERRKLVRLARARAMWDNDAVEYSDSIAHNAQRPGSRLYSERRGVDIPEYSRHAT